MLSLFMLACLAASSVSCPVPRQVAQPSSTLDSGCLFPPPATVAPQLPDHITLVVPSPFSTDSESASTSPSTSSSIPTPSLTTLTTNEDDSARRQEAHKHKLHNIIYFYIIPIFSFVGVICLSAVCWLVYGCCTRRPRYRNASQGTRGRGHEKDWDCSSDDGGAVEAFRAFRYEDFLPPSNTNLNDIDDDNYTSYTQSRSCQHTHEFGFECDCSHDQQRQRQSVVERELYRDRFKWPDINEGIREEADEEGSMRFSFSSNKKSPDISLCSQTTTANAAISPTTPLPTPTVVSPATAITSTRTESISSSISSSIRTQTNIFESVQERLDREVVVPEEAVSVKKRESARGEKDECEEGFQIIVEEELERDEDEQNQPLVYSRALITHQRGGRQRGTTPTSHVDERMEYKKRNWLNKMVNSFSRISSEEEEGGKVGDRYTVLPGSSEVGVSMKTMFSSTRSRDRTPHRQHRLPRISTLDPANANANASTTDYDGDLSEEIARQKERLAKHRESIASLPVGMVYSPPLVGFCVFDGGEDGRGRVRGEMRREKRLPPRPL